MTDCPGCLEPMPGPGAGYACPAVTGRANMTVCNAPACSPACGHPIRFVPRPPGGGTHVHDWASR